MSSTTWEVNKKKEKSRQVTAFAAGLGSSCLERVVIPYTNSPSTNPNAKVVRFCESANIFRCQHALRGKVSSLSR